MRILQIYTLDMPRSTPTGRRPGSDKKSQPRHSRPTDAGRAPARQRPNRIYELTQSAGWTYADVAERAGVHEITIARLATGAIKLSQDWMHRLGEIYGVPYTDVITAPPTIGLRQVRVSILLSADVWSDDHRLNDDETFDVFIADDPSLSGLTFYAGEIRGDMMNARYPDRSVVVLSKLTQRPNEIQEGKRYHVRVTRPDGKSEETIKTLTKDSSGQYWLKPESTEPRHRAIPLDGTPDETVELLGRVRFVVHREE